MTLSPAEQDSLLSLSRNTLKTVLAGEHAEPPALETLPESLRQKGCAFVTLHVANTGALRGCTGSLKAYRPLALDVAANSIAAATTDPRFPAVTLAELPNITIEISVLSPQALLRVANEADLIQQLKPGKDGLTIDDGARRATFLPMVWAQIPEPINFVRHLKAKAGMGPDEWPKNLKCYHYQADCFAEAHQA